MGENSARPDARKLFLGLREIDADDALREQFQADPRAVVEGRGLESAFSSTAALDDFVGTFEGLTGEAWLATFHSFLDWLEGRAQDAPTVPHVTFSLDGDGNVQSVANRGGNSRSSTNPFYSRERADSSASDVAAMAETASGPAVTIFDGYEESDVSAALSDRYVSVYYQRTMIKAHVRRASTGADLALDRMRYRDVHVELGVEGDAERGLRVTSASLAPASA